jgi:hypothetical protein
MRKKVPLAVVPDQDDDTLDEIGLPRDEWGDFTPTGQPRCKGVKADGLRCRAFQGRSGYCFFHDPNITPAQKNAQRAKGGHHNSRVSRAERMLPDRLKPVFTRLESAMQEVVDGTLSPTRAQALASLASASVRVLEAGEIEEKVRKMEAAAEGDEYAEDGDPTPTPDSDD